jgi:hypothetical protein
MNQKTTPKLLIFLMFISACNLLMAQSTDFYYKDRGKNLYSATLYFSDAAGNETVSPEDFRESETIYFSVKTNPLSEKKYFKDKDIEDYFVPLRLTQNGRTVKNKSYPKPIPNADGDIGTIVLSYAQEDLKLYLPFVFVNALDTTEALTIKDVYYNSFEKYEPLYDEALNTSAERDYISTFNKIATILKDAETNEEILHYSFFSHASEVLPETAIEQYADSINTLFVAANKDFLVDLSEQGLARIDSVYGLMTEGFRIFKPYFEMNFSQSKALGEMYKEMLENADEMRLKNYTRFKNHIISFLEKESYDNYQFRFYVDLLAHMITGLDTLQVLERMDTIDISKLNKFKQKQQELYANTWHNDFRLLVQMLNKEIIETGRAFNDSIMMNLQQQKNRQHQPYFEIFLAFNHLSFNLNLFQSYLKTAIGYCSDMDMINNMEMWILSGNITNENLTPSVVKQINKGITRVNQRSWDEAFALFTNLTRQAANSAASWYYLGRAQFEKGEAFSSENKFERALEIYPAYIAPRIFTFRILDESSRTNDLLVQVEEAIRQNDVWLFRYWKAKTLYELGNYNEAINEVENHCENLNPYNLDQYFLLGDAYKAVKKYADAEKAYRKTYEIDIYAADKTYNERMELLHFEMKQ